MPDWLNSPGELLTVLSIAAICIAALSWLVRSHVIMAREFKPNGGSTTRDALDRIEKKLDTVERKIDNHIQWHLGE